ncbi:MAG: amylo-alpha-1,6-glucosidase, partial [Cyanobacteria bacterium P01_C01_bin.72]
NEVYQNFQLPREAYRGLNDRDSHLHVATFSATLQPGESLTFVASTAIPNALTGQSLELDHADVLSRLLDGKQALSDRYSYEQELIEAWQAANPDLTTPKEIGQLVLAADQFLVERQVDNNVAGKSIIAGYHWFNDWGRDTMISLPGLTLATGRPEIARLIITTFAEYISQGMLPNRFPDGDRLTDADYNTVDATLWYFEAVRQYYAQTKDQEFLQDIFPKLAEIIDWHRRGTRFGIKLDEDGLLKAGVEGVQLTWMDALVNGEVITPRYGKPIEVNALWYNALRTMAAFATTLGQAASQYQQMAEATQKGFARFWNQATGYCYDVLDSPDGTNDPSLRPNQIFALSLPECPLTREQQQGVIQACQQSLLTSYGLRSLERHNAQYQGHYGGDQYQRDSSYHQGTVWGWLMGSFALAHFRVYGDRDRALSFLEPMVDHLNNAGLGSISEIFDGDAPFPPRGCIAQAWSVAEVLRAWQLIAKG